MIRIFVVLGRIFRSRRRERDLREELQYHLDRQAAGADAEERRRLAAQFGGVEPLVVEARQRGPRRWLDEAAQDLRHAVRSWARSPGLCLLILATLALGIGSTTSVFSILDGLVYRPLEVPRSGELLAVAQHVRGAARSTRDDATYVSEQEFQRYAAGSASAFQGLAAYMPSVPASLERADALKPLVGDLATCNYFRVLSARPELGRLLAPGDCAAGAPAVAVLSDAAWRKEFGADPSLVGRAIVLNRVPVAVIGVAPPGFWGTEVSATDFWAPVTLEPALMPEWNVLVDANTSWLALLGRLRQGVSPSQAQAALSLTSRQLDREEAHRRTTVSVSSPSLLASPQMRSKVLLAATVLLIAMGLVLLVACINVANLLLARGLGRQREWAVRMALGASRGRIVRQSLVETMVLALGGGAAGMLTSRIGGRGLIRLALAQMPPHAPFRVPLAADGRTLGFGVGVTLATAAVCCLLPALRSARGDVNPKLRDAGPGVSAGARAHRLRNALVAAQVAACMVLLLAAGVLFHSRLRMLDGNPGFRLGGIASITYDLAHAGYDGARAAGFQRQLRDRLLALPGVATVAAATTLPLGDRHDFTGFVAPDGRDLSVEDSEISPGFLPLLDIPLLRGRNFTAADFGARRLILSAAAAKRFFPEADAVGQSLRRGKQLWQIVGVAADAQVAELGVSDSNFVYLSESPDGQADLKMMVGLHAGATIPAGEVRATVHALDPQLPVEVAPLADNLQIWRLRSGLLSNLAGTLGMLAMLLAGTGLAGLLSCEVRARQREIGIRVALGAAPKQIAGHVAGQMRGPLGSGIVAGLALGAACFQVLSHVLYGVSPWDPATFLLMPLLLLAVVLFAAAAPLRRALRLDPVQVLRED